MLQVMNHSPTSSDRHTRRAFVKASAVVAATPVVSAQQMASKAPMREIETDVLVCGGGCAGTAAALSAARNGAKTLLVEKAPFAGGIITSVGLPYFDGISDIKTHRVVVRGIALELLAKTGVCKADAKEIKPHNPTIPNTFEFKVLLDRELQACGDKLTVLFNSFVCDAESANGRVTSVVIANKDGLVRIKPKGGFDPAKVNPNGSGISLGHPVGATGAIITTKAIAELHRTGGRYALVTMCIGGGQGIAAIFERV